jgi:hypothetical protein
VRRTLAVLALAIVAGCGGEPERRAELRQCGGSYDDVIAWIEATPDVNCIEALAFADHAVGYTLAPSPCFRGGEYGGAAMNPCEVNGWMCEIRDQGEPRRGVFDCTDEDRGRRMRLTSLYALGERPRKWDEDDPFDPADPTGTFRRYHLICRDTPLAELAEAYETTADRPAVLAGIQRWMGIVEARRGCDEGFRARDVLGRHDDAYLESSW